MPFLPIQPASTRRTRAFGGLQSWLERSPSDRAEERRGFWVRGFGAMIFQEISMCVVIMLSGQELGQSEVARIIN